MVYQPPTLLTTFSSKHWGYLCSTVEGVEYPAFAYSVVTYEVLLGVEYFTPSTTECYDDPLCNGNCLLVSNKRKSILVSKKEKKEDLLE